MVEWITQSTEKKRESRGGRRSKGDDKATVSSMVVKPRIRVSRLAASQSTVKWR